MRSVRDFLRTLWDLIWSLVRNVLVIPVSTGTLNLRSQPPMIAGITWVVAAIIGVLIAGIIAANPLRELTDFIAVVDETGNSVVPAFMIPLMLFLLAIAIALVLAGSQRLRLWLRVMLLIACSAILAFLVSSSITVQASGAAVVIPWTALGLIIGYSFVIWTGRTNAAIDVGILLILVTIVTLFSYRSFVAGIAVIETRFDLVTTTTLLVTLVSLAMPLAFVSGINATRLGVSIAEQAGAFIGRRVPVLVASIILVGVIIWQVVAIMPNLLNRWSALGPVDSLGAFAGGVLIILACIALWQIAHYRADRRELVEEDTSQIAADVTLPIAYTLLAPILLSNLAALTGVTVALGRSEQAQAFVLALVDALASNTAILIARVVLLIGLVFFAVRMMRRGRPRTAAVLLIDAFFIALIIYGPGLTTALRLNWSVVDLGNIGLVIGVVLFTMWAVRRSLTPDRLVVLYSIVLLSALIRQADYFALPIGFLIGASAIALLIVGLIWGFLTDGGAAHEDTPYYPRQGKILLFLGNFLFGIAIVAWAAIAKQVALAAQLADTTALAVASVGSAYVIINVLDTTRSWRRGRQALVTATPPSAPVPGSQGA